MRGVAEIRAAEPSLRDGMAILLRRAPLAMAIFLAVFLSGGAYVLLSTPRYQSTAKLVVRFGERAVPDLDRAAQGEISQADRREIVLSNAEILRSHDMARAVIEAFGVGAVYPDIVADPPRRWSVMDEAVRTFLDQLDVEVGQQDNVISVSLLHPDQALVPRLVTRLVALYQAREAAVWRDPALAFQQAQVEAARRRLDRAQVALEAFKTRWRITAFDAEVEELLKHRSEVEGSLQAARAALAQAARREAELRVLLGRVPPEIAAPANGERYRASDDAQAKLSDLRARERQLLATYRPGSPVLDQVRADIAGAEAALRARGGEVARRAAPVPNPVFQNLQTDHLRAVAEADSAASPVRVQEAALAQVERRLAELQDRRGAFDTLVRARQIAEETFRALSVHADDARVKAGLNASGVSHAAVISVPTVPYRPARPRRLITLAASAFAGGLLALGGVLAAEAVDDRYALPFQVVRGLGVPVLASFAADAWGTAT